MDTKVLTELTQSIATALGSEWFVELNDDNWARRINNSTSPNVRLYVAGDGYNNPPTKCTISGSLHIGENGQYVQVYETAKDGSGWHRQDPGSISVTIARGPEVIAKEIKRRFLPEYLRILALAEAQVAKDREYKNTKQGNLVRLAKAANVPMKNLRDESSMFTISRGEIYGDVTANADSAEIKLRSLTIEQAEQVLQFVRTL